MKPNLDQKLIDARPEKAPANSAFVERTVEAARRASAGETFERVMRTTNATKKERFIMKLKTLPKALSGTLAGLAIMLASGSAFAAYQLWAGPSAAPEVASLAQKLQNCRQSASTSANISIDTSSGISADDQTKLRLAHCEISTIREWAQQTMHALPGEVSFAYTITAANSSSLELSGNEGRQNVKLSSDTRFAASGSAITSAQLKPGDVVAYVSASSKAQARAVIKLGAPVAYYSTEMQSLVAVRVQCTGNPAELCVSGGVNTVKLTLDNSASASSGNNSSLKVLEGKLISHNSAGFTLQGSSGTTYKVSTDTTQDLIADFNASNGKQSGGATANTGDTIRVEYRQPASTDPTNIPAEQLENASLLLPVTTNPLPEL
jgi:hypothetical protein